MTASANGQVINNKKEQGRSGRGNDESVGRVWEWFACEACREFPLIKYFKTDYTGFIKNSFNKLNIEHYRTLSLVVTVLPTVT